jgi:uncharacterized phiE125 gp8 family phage protein
MALVLTAPPAVEPITLAEAKAHLRVDANDEDMLIGSLIVAARSFVERSLSLAMISQSWSLYLDRWPRSREVALPIAPAQSVEAIRVYDSDNQPTEIASEDYVADVLSVPGRLLLAATATPIAPARELNAVEIVFIAGYGDEPEDVPAPIRQALLLLITHWFESREPVVLGEAPYEVPATVASLLLSYRRVRL